MKFDQVYDHLIIKGFDPSYTIWVFHGEIYNSQSQGECSSGGIHKDDKSRDNKNQQEQVASGGIGSGIGNEVGSNSDINIGAKKSCDFDFVKKHIATAQSNLKNVSCGDIYANNKCKLLHWYVDGLVVAEGRIASTDPNTKVHHVVLGGSCWKVWVDKVLVEKVDLIRPNDEMQFLDDAMGSTVAWLSKFIVLCD